MDQIESGSGKIRNKEFAPAGDAKASTRAFDQGNVLYSKLRPNLNKVVRPDEPGIATTELIPLRPIQGVLDPDYLAYYLRSPRFLLFAENMVSGAKMPRIVMEEFWGHRIPLPPLPEQRRIADILDKADAIRNKRREAIALTDELLRATFLDMFGDPVTNPKGLDRSPISDFGNVITGNTPSRARPAFYGTDIEWIKSDNINTPSHFLTKATEGLSKDGAKVARIAEANSVLVTCIAGSESCIGNAAIAERKVAFNQQINAVVPRDGIDFRFLFAQILVGKRLIQQASTNAMKGMVSKSAFSAIQLLNPPSDKQIEFGNWFDRLIRMRKRMDQATESGNSMYGSLVQRAFRGDL